MKRLITLVAGVLLLCIALSGQSTLTTFADITGDGNAHTFGTGTARWCQIVTVSTNSAAVRIGDSNTSATRGIPLAPGSAQMLPPLPQISGYLAADATYDLTQLYYVAGAGDKFSLACVR